ncbi:class I SAM-dependent methyltransferase [Mycolicibacterium sp. 018/SC-01/001]|uniref:class I SAM-dependent methyltransferase n=1 Tax=Mycolicibacterium sp. 018/SC-01/001 TaxID=2592069 RepID=UPI0011803C4F|nr:class I SAM-dependent methyltransferase [Mycolicibacterium sp. 018/SC-01/001]TRW81719.1 class I SAM-dependent methyltransferase [Mycolicibacterium sp. 018/SC-01/001]
MSRTDGDSWDLATSVGATATSVAASRAAASRGPDPLLDDPYAEMLVTAVGVDHFTALARGEIDVVDGGRQYMAVRTRFFDKALTDAAAAGVRQIVILAAGLDTRAYRLDWPAGTTVFELDQPQVIEFKTRVLSDAGVTPSAHRVAVGVDLRDDWPQTLRRNGFDPGRPSAWIAEGLLIYLPPDAQDRLLDNIGALSAPGSVLATEHMDPGAMTADWAKEFSERSRRHGGTIDLSELFYAGERTPAGDHLARAGWQITVLSNADAYAAQGFTPPTDELLSMLGDSGYLTARREEP